MKREKQILVKQEPYSLNELYDKYAGMLFGYINQSVNDDKLAEQHLVGIYNNISTNLNGIYSNKENTWCQLQRIAKKYLLSHYNGTGNNHNFKQVDIEVYKNYNRFLNFMTSEQKEIFCSIYYRHKTTIQLSKELNIPEDSIRKTLKDAFAIIKQKA